MTGDWPPDGFSTLVCKLFTKPSDGCVTCCFGLTGSRREGTTSDGGCLSVRGSACNLCVAKAGKQHPHMWHAASAHVSAPGAQRNPTPRSLLSDFNLLPKTAGAYRMLLLRITSRVGVPVPHALLLLLHQLVLCLNHTRDGALAGLLQLACSTSAHMPAQARAVESAGVTAKQCSKATGIHGSGRLVTPRTVQTTWRLSVQPGAAAAADEAAAVCLLHAKAAAAAVLCCVRRPQPCCATPPPSTFCSQHQHQQPKPACLPDASSCTRTPPSPPRPAPYRFLQPTDLL